MEEGYVNSFSKVKNDGCADEPLIPSPHEERRGRGLGRRAGLILQSSALMRPAREREAVCDFQILPGVA